MNVIFGVYNGYNSLTTDKGGIYYFAKSLRKYNQDCKVVVLCEQDKVFEGLEELCVDYNFEIYSDFTFEYDLMLYRYKVYQQVLTAWGNQGINKVLFCDLDDVVFQADPFSIEFDEQLYCAAEKNILSDTRNSSSGLNRYWIEQASYVTKYTSNTFENQPVVCAGTILGKYSGVLDVLKFYNNALRNRISYREIPDQGLYNIYIYNHTGADFKKILPYKESQILTLDNVVFDELSVQEGKVVNNNGQTYAIIHQINRCNPEFMKGLAEDDDSYYYTV